MLFSKSRLTLALALVLSLAFAALAFADGASQNNAIVDGSVKPSKLDKKKYKPVDLFLGVRNETTVTPDDTDNPASEYISISKNVKLNLKKSTPCPTVIGNGTTTEAAMAQCGDSYLGSGEAEVQSAPNTVIATPVVNVFHGPGPNDVQLHTYSEDLGPASPVVPGTIENSKVAGFGQALNVPIAPETGPLMITKFNATIEKSTKVATARCKSKKITYQRDTVYKDGSTDVATLEQKCKRKKKK